MSRVCVNKFSCYTFYMILWHKQLIIFLAKIFGVILLIIAVALFFYYQYYFKKDNLLKYVPKNAVYYSTFRLNNQIKEEPPIKNFLINLDSDLNKLNFDNLNYLVGYNLSLALLPNFSHDNLNFDYLIVADLNDEQPVDSFLNIINKYNLKHHLFKNQVLEKNILIVSNSQEIIEKVKKVASLQEPSLAQRANVLINLNKFKINYSGKIFLDPEYLYNNLNKINDLKLKLFLLSLKNDNLDQIYLGMKTKENKIIIESPNFTLLNNNGQQLMNKLPKDTVLSYSFNNGQAEFNDILELIKETDIVTFNSIQENLANWQKLYKFDWNQDILALFSQQTQLIIQPENKFIIASNLTNLNDQEEKISKLENIIKEYLANLHPIEKEKTLPDYTKITQIVKDPSLIIFNNKEIQGKKYKYASYQNSEIAYIFLDNNIILTNSSENLENLLVESNLSAFTEISPCFESNSNLYIKSNILPNFSQYFTDLVIIDRLVESNKIWLCLE